MSVLFTILLWILVAGAQASTVETYWNKVLPKNTAPPGRQGAGTAYCAQQDTAFVFGGTLQRQESIFFWAYDFQENTWNEVQSESEVSLNTPSELSYGDLYMLGGQQDATLPSGSPCRMLYTGARAHDSESKVSLGTWVVTVSIENNTTNASSRYAVQWDIVPFDSSVAFPENRHYAATAFWENNLYVFSGLLSSFETQVVDDFWVFKLSADAPYTGSWERLDREVEVDSVEVRPKARLYAAATMLDANQSDKPTLVMYGGATLDDTSSISVSNEMWLFDINSNSWTLYPAPSSNPLEFARMRHSLVSIGSNVMQFGGMLQVGGGGESLTLHVFDKSLFATVDPLHPLDSADHVHPQRLCGGGPASGSDDSPVTTATGSPGLWCEDRFTRETAAQEEYKLELLQTPYRRFAHSALVRQPGGAGPKQLVVLGGSGSTSAVQTRSRTFFLNDVWIANAETMVNDWQAVFEKAEEEITHTGGIRFTPVTLFLMLFGTFSSFIVYHLVLGRVLKRRSIDLSEFAEEDCASRGARLSLIKRLPLVAFAAKEASGRGGEEEGGRQGDGGDEAEDGKDSQWQDDCAVCLVEFEDKELLRQLPCGHEYHPDCVDEWLKKNKSCPLCKVDIDELLQLEPGARPWDPITNGTEDDEETRAQTEQLFTRNSARVGFSTVQAPEPSERAVEAFEVAGPAIDSGASGVQQLGASAKQKVSDASKSLSSAAKNIKTLLGERVRKVFSKSPAPPTADEEV